MLAAFLTRRREWCTLSAGCAGPHGSGMWFPAAFLKPLRRASFPRFLLLSLHIETPPTSVSRTKHHTMHLLPPFVLLSSFAALAVVASLPMVSTLCKSACLLCIALGFEKLQHVAYRLSQRSLSALSRFFTITGGATLRQGWWTAVQQEVWTEQILREPHVQGTLYRWSMQQRYNLSRRRSCFRRPRYRLLLRHDERALQWLQDGQLLNGRGWQWSQGMRQRPSLSLSRQSATGRASGFRPSSAGSTHTWFHHCLLWSRNPSLHSRPVQSYLTPSISSLSRH